MPPKPREEKLPMNVVDKKWFPAKAKSYEPYWRIDHAKHPEKTALKNTADFFGRFF